MIKEPEAYDVKVSVQLYLVHSDEFAEPISDYLSVELSKLHLFYQLGDVLIHKGTGFTLYEMRYEKAKAQVFVYAR